MARLVIISGASGAGKSFLLQQLNKFIGDIACITKKTTRGPRKGEPKDRSLDLEFNCSKADVNKCDYKYLYCEHLYGLSKQDINKVLAGNKSPVVIIADCAKINEIKKDYKTALVLYVQNILSGEDLEARLIEYNDPIDVDRRIERQKYSFSDYIRNIENNIFDYVLINDFSEAFIPQIQYVYDKEIAKGVDSNYIFVIMSFDSKYNEIYEAIKIGGQIFKGIKIERADDIIGDGEFFIIMERIEEKIKKAGVIICDITESSPNVYYELGYAMTRNKNIIVVARQGTKIPFDNALRRVIFYDTPVELQALLIKALRGIIRWHDL